MTIAERKAREAYDRLNPWRPMRDAVPDGTVCNLLFADLAGHFDADHYQYFLDGCGNWYRLDPPGICEKRPMNWRPAYWRLSPERRRIAKMRAAEVRT